MKISERATLVDHELAKLYPNPPIPLDHKDSYTLLIAVLLSAQCTDARVNKITPNLFQLASNPFSMSQLSVDEINSIVRPCGLSPRKAQAIHGLSQILLDKHEGQVPRSFEELEELPGVGHKTASVVMAQSFGFPSFPVDTHIHRLAQRWKLTSGKSVLFFISFIKHGNSHCSFNGICNTGYRLKKHQTCTAKAYITQPGIFLELSAMGQGQKKK